MSESQVGFLYKAASTLNQATNNESIRFLRSYYLMRCKEITKGYGLPEKHFSSKVRCSRCCIEWNKETQTKVKSNKLSKKQRHRIRSQKDKKGNAKSDSEKNKLLLSSNEIEQICSFCKQSTYTIAAKPKKIKTLKPDHSNTQKITNVKIGKVAKNLKTTKEAIVSEKIHKKKSNETNVYRNATEIFSFRNNRNVLASSKKEEPKVIKNNKKKKDKFAGLCQKAVLASAKMKQQTDKQNKLNLFLKPSSSTS